MYHSCLISFVFPNRHNFGSNLWWLAEYHIPLLADGCTTGKIVAVVIQLHSWPLCANTTYCRVTTQTVCPGNFSWLHGSYANSFRQVLGHRLWCNVTVNQQEKHLSHNSKTRNIYNSFVLCFITSIPFYSCLWVGSSKVKFLKMQ